MGAEFKLYWQLVGAQLRGKLQYKASTITEMAAQFMLTFIDFAAVAVLFNQFPTLQGWSLNEIAFLYGTATVSFSLSQVVVRGFELFDRYIQMGDLDRILLRPVSPFVQVLAAELALSRLGRLGQGVAVLIFGLAGLNIQWDPLKILLFLLTISAGMLIFVAIFTIGAVTTIWTVSTTEFTNIFTYGGMYLTSFPLSIYQEWFRNFFVFIVPIGFINYLPALIILDKAGQSGFPLWLGWLDLPIAIAFFGLALLFWEYGLRKYQSTGS
jgi:ABC-2 type transport system permease protein